MVRWIDVESEQHYGIKGGGLRTVFDNKLRTILNARDSWPNMQHMRKIKRIEINTGIRDMPMKGWLYGMVPMFHLIGLGMLTCGQQHFQNIIIEVVMSVKCLFYEQQLQFTFGTYLLK